MKFVLAPNAFKESLSGVEVANAMAQGIRRVLPDAEIVCCPVSDGGDGLVDVLTESLGGTTPGVMVSDPLGRSLTAHFGWVADRATGIIEMARVSGLALLDKEERDPCKTTTWGTGELMREALELGARRLIVGIGGSATCDGGIGMAGALGARFFDGDGERIRDLCGGNLNKIEIIDVFDLCARLKGIEVDVVCDVDNPLLGEKGAARVYGPQKGASPEQVEQLEAGLAHLAEVLERDLDLDVRDMAGAGAAGGLGAGLRAFCDARLRPGVDVVCDMVGLDAALEDADLAFTGEGAVDEQTAYGKAPAGVGIRAKKRGVPCLLIAGAVCGDMTPLHDKGITACFSLCNRPMELQAAMDEAAELVARATEQATRAFLAGKTTR